MATLTLDTHEFIKRLVKEGIPENQAEAIADGFQQANLSHVATKQDIVLLKEDIAELEARLTTRMMTFHSVTVALLGILMTMLTQFT